MVRLTPPMSTQKHGTVSPFIDLLMQKRGAAETAPLVMKLPVFNLGKSPAFRDSR